jgi:hypothetical protein
MRDLRVATQLFLGEHELRSFTLREISLRIRRAKELAGIDSLMIWTGADPTLYEPLVRTCQDCAVMPYLWFAVLADAQGVAIDQDELLLHYDGTRGYGSTGAWQGLGGGEEHFLFCCPNRTGAVQRVFSVYSGLLDRLEFGGVMLDRIRYPSAVNGLESLFGCYCEDCQEKFREMFGTSLEVQRQTVAAFLSRLARLDRLPAENSGSWRSFADLWAEAGLSGLSRFKERSVARVVERFAGAARARGLRVALDLYSPSLAPTVSQDYGLLSRCCDWLKPMIYCHAVGPAGLPLELAWLQRAFQAACPSLNPGEVRELLRGLLPWDWPEAEESLLAQGLPEQTLTAELDRLSAEELAPGISVLAGLEAIRNPAFRVDITRQSLERSLVSLRGRVDGLVASWNLLYIPEENLRAVGAFARQA